MHDDEAAIRELVATWMAATRAGDAAAVLELMTDDVVFLVAGQAPFGKAEFAAAMRAQAGAALRFDGRSEIREVRVCGDWAFAWARLAVTATVPGQPPVRRAGHTLSVFRRDDGRWRLARDANLLVKVDADA
ncbi:MAG TPA: SgcJ/EcaC family oxidoreductase [Luteimonas sp.]|nr:SgcJ/EcaC family oxidoreductase [Luteimonas sp.]